MEFHVIDETVRLPRDGSGLDFASPALPEPRQAITIKNRPSRWSLAPPAENHQPDCVTPLTKDPTMTPQKPSETSLFRPLAEAASWAREQGIRGPIDWRYRARNHPGWLPADVPVDPEEAYAEDFACLGGWGGFLGTDRVANRNRVFRPLPEVVAWASSQGITGAVDWFRRNRDTPGWRPDDIPANPANVYGQAFRDIGGWGAFLGTGHMAPGHHAFRPIEEAAAWARQSGAGTASDWFRLCRQPGWRPRDIPANPDDAYGAAFRDLGGWGAFLGTYRVAAIHRRFRAFSAAADWARQQDVASQADWKRRNRETPGWRPDDIPANPANVYGAEMLASGGWGAFLGTGRIAHVKQTFRPLAEAAAWAHQQGVTSQADWARHIHDNPKWRPEDIPADPSKTYGQAFQDAGGWGAFLGTGFVSTRQRVFRPLAEAATWAHQQGVTSQADWERRAHDDPKWRPVDIPGNPSEAYGAAAFRAIGGWRGFLGTVEKRPHAAPR